MARVVVTVMPKQDILDPQGQAVQRALGRLGVAGITDVRQGKRFVIDTDGTTPLADIERVAATLLANTVIEDWAIADVQVTDDSDAAGCGATGEKVAQ